MRSMACEVLRLDARQQAQRRLQRFDGRFREAAALQADAVGAEHAHFRLIAGERVGHHVLLDDAVRPDEGVAPDAAELVHAAEGR